MLTTCSEPGCATLVMGGRCVEHERPPTRVFVRGRPFIAVGATASTGPDVVASVASTSVASAVDVRGESHFRLEPSRN
jgi:hypothetical protein